MTEDQRDQVLIGLSEKIDRLDQKIDSVEENVSTKIKELDQKIDKVEGSLTKELVKQRQNMVRMEFELKENINALHDGRLMNLEKLEKHSQRFKSIENILDEHNLKILALESKFK